MTDKTDAKTDAVAVEQNDRDAAEQWRNAFAADHDTDAVVDELAEDFARHRLAALAAIDNTPPPAGVALAAQFLLDRINDLEWDVDENCAFVRDWYGHVDPAIGRLTAALRQPPASAWQDEIRTILEDVLRSPTWSEALGKVHNALAALPPATIPLADMDHSGFADSGA